MNELKLKPSTIRMRRLIERRKKGIALPNCLSCGAKCISPVSISHEMCSQCRRDAPQGRAVQVKNAYKSMERRARFEALEESLGSSWEWKWNDAKTIVPFHSTKVAVETLRGAKTIATYGSESGWVDTVDGGKIRVRYWAEIPLVDEPVNVE